MGQPFASQLPEPPLGPRFQQPVLRQGQAHLGADLVLALLVQIEAREILTRFYLYEQSQDQICSEMGLTLTQFRLLKSRAKGRFGELGRKRLTHRNIPSVFVRTSAGSS